ncbi:NAD-dependent deacetylase [Cohaesibacter sp. ES.047]|uniref:SIR2 family NAD-dependent protein deacylase n=1 Tax=Cohaesibacter sp. ES.047 TaxID=1798205 RepID=UPI000BB7C94C|nr:Sir2 family NAD-dependent protein deacetylase [Cohaesibacter sp. ES.047]SNY93527.1 NAD-dependent deacetylase [Cohaesibacter sp. ES.047]
MDCKSHDEKLALLGEMIEEAETIVAFTGAGISTESGIPDFRSPNGLWSQMDPIMFDDFVASEETRLEDWRRRFIMNKDFAVAKPNEGHKALVRMAKSGKLISTITQNIDGLHQRSGLPEHDVVEIHGNSTYGACLECDSQVDLKTVRRTIDETGASPRCDHCGGLVKAAIINFGQAMPEAKMHRAMQDAADCDLFIVLGSSLQVYPAANLPQIAKHHDARLVIINRDPTPFDRIADLYIHGEIGSTLKTIART